ncbi:hypothetical protein J3F84DRAFT_363649 [Trichoderma pleuroticola]
MPQLATSDLLHPRHCLSAARKSSLARSLLVGTNQTGLDWTGLERHLTRHKKNQGLGCVLRLARGRAHEGRGCAATTPKTGSPAGAGGAERPAARATHRLPRGTATFGSGHSGGPVQAAVLRRYHRRLSPFLVRPSSFLYEYPYNSTGHSTNFALLCCCPR